MTSPYRTVEWSGKPISVPGLYSRIPLETYHSAGICKEPSISSSVLRTITGKSPAHYWVSSPYNPKRIEQNDAKHFIFGRAVHHLVLRELYSTKSFAQLFAVHPERMIDPVKGEVVAWHGNRNVCKQWLEAREKEGRAVLTPEDAVHIQGMAEALGRNSIVLSGALQGQIERSGFHFDKRRKLWIKIRPDAIPTDSGNYVDLKTITSVQWRILQSAIFDHGYHQQFALIRFVCRELGWPFEDATLVFVEKTPPYCVRIVSIKHSALDRGERQNNIALDTFAECLRTNTWPGPGDGEDAETIDLPDYATKQIDYQLKGTTEQ